MTSTFRGLNSGVYRVMVWNDAGTEPYSPDYGDEFGFTTDTIDLFLFSEYTVKATTSTEWTEMDGDPYVTPVN